MPVSKPNQRILVLCEGLTEYNYARGLQAELPRQVQRYISIEVDYESGNDPENLLKEAKRRRDKAKKERNPYDSIWLFFDNDNWPQLKKAFEIIRRENFEFSYSSICIEHWFILHFEFCGKLFPNAEAALNYLKRIWPGYHKTKIKHYDILKPNLEKALKRSEHIRENSLAEIPLHQKNPYFTVDQFIVFFKRLQV